MAIWEIKVVDPSIYLHNESSNNAVEVLITSDFYSSMQSIVKFKNSYGSLVISSNSLLLHATNGYIISNKIAILHSE